MSITPVESEFKMSDFDAFGDDTNANEQPPLVQEEDPAAAFLAREQDELKGLEDDNFGEDNNIQTTQGNHISTCWVNVSTPPFLSV